MEHVDNMYIVCSEVRHCYRRELLPPSTGLDHSSKSPYISLTVVLGVTVEIADTLVHVFTVA